MLEHTTNVGVTHVWPYNKLVNPEAQPFSNERDAEVWDELRDLTFDEDVRGNVFVALHTSLNHDAYAGDFKREIEKDDVVNNRVMFYRPREGEFNVHRPATPEHTFQPLRSVDEEFTLGPDGWEEVPDTSAPIVILAKSACDEKETRRIPFNLGSRVDAQFVVKQFNNHEICGLVLWHPDEPGQRTHLPLVRSKCPDLPIYIFHCDYRTDKYGVEREGGASGSWQSRFHSKTEALTIPEDVDVVVRGLCNVGSVSMWGALPKHGKSYLFPTLMKALLTGK